mmetsp:Transcript_43370/g.110972  ORF Transcript_43370/g.110972 Transcript_43370/m.110972 type:complete len:117 (+) Transcript_43370:95-445(+)|eukprot:jgi/Tetstr1/432526/TSEL_021899.t1
MSLLASTMTRFGASMSGVSVQSRPASSQAMLAGPRMAPVIECASRRNPKKEKAQRNRRRANELRRLKMQKSGQRPGFFQRRNNNNNNDEATVSEDYVSPFQYDARGEPLVSTSTEN